MMDQKLGGAYLIAKEDRLGEAPKVVMHEDGVESRCCRRQHEKELRERWINNLQRQGICSVP